MVTYRQERRRYSCRWSIFLVAWSSEWNWYAGFRKKTPSLETKLQCGAAFPSHQFLQGDPQCSLQFQSTRAKNRCPALAGCSTSRHTSTRVLGDCGEAPHDQQTALRCRHSCRKKISCSWISEWGWSSTCPFVFPLPPVRMRTWGASGVGTGVSGCCVCLHLPPAVPALVLVLLPREQIVGCIRCSWPLPDVNPCVLAIDGWSKNSPCFPVYSGFLWEVLE